MSTISFPPLSAMCGRSGTVNNQFNTVTANILKNFAATPRVPHDV